MLKKTFILLNECDIKYIPKSTKNIFTFSPFLAKEIQKEKLKVDFPNPNKTVVSSEIILAKVQEYSDAITDSIEMNRIFKYINEYEELIAPYLYLRLSQFFYIKEFLPESESYYLFVDSNWKFFNKKIDVIIQIEKRLSEQNYFYKEIFDFGDRYNSLTLVDEMEFIFNRFLGFIQKIIFKFLINNNTELFILSDSKQYFLPKIKNYLKSKDKMTMSLVSWQSSLGKIKSLLKLLINIISKKAISDATFFLIPIKKLNIIDIQKKIYSIFPSIINEDEKFIKRLILDISTYLVVTDGYQKYLFSLLNKKNIKNTFLHSTRFSELYSLASIMSKRSSNIFLISHGTHTLHNNNYLNSIANKQLALGLLYSKLENIIHCSQSLFSDDYLSSIKFKFKKINHLSILNPEKSNRKNSKFKILHASTIKTFNQRSYYYESSFEYISGIKVLAKKLSSLADQLEIVVRAGFIKEELTYECLKDELRDFNKFVKISSNKDFLKDLADCNCLISLSSTTLEQAFSTGIPCLSYGFTKYNHFGSYLNLNIDKTHQDFHILNQIEKKLESKFIYSASPENSREDFFGIIAE